jgi:hypothetical protein
MKVDNNLFPKNTTTISIPTLERLLVKGELEKIMSDQQ